MSKFYTPAETFKDYIIDLASNSLIIPTRDLKKVVRMVNAEPSLLDNKWIKKAYDHAVQYLLEWEGSC